MPKLSAYVEEQPCKPNGAAGAAVGAAQSAAGAAPEKQQQQLPQQPAQQQQQQHEQQEQPQSSHAMQTELGEQHSAAAAKLQADYAKRLREHGPRTYRWSDGSLRPERPPPYPHAVANRRQWAPLVQHCRTHGGDRTYERQGHSLRHGLGVTQQQHESYLALVGLQPEADVPGKHAGEAPSLPSPLEDPEHCFNTYYKEGADAVFQDKRGRLL